VIEFSIMKKIVFFLILCTGFLYASGQEVYNSSGKQGFHKKTKKSKGYDPSKLVLGGGLSAVFGDGYALAGISPIVGYRVANNFCAGVGLGYLYQKSPDWYFPTLSDKYNIVYPNVWARYTVWRGLYATGAYEYDIISLTEPIPDGITGFPVNTTIHVSANCLLAGVGIKQPLGGRVSFFVEIMHEFLQEQYSPYVNEPLIFRAGVCAGL